MPRRRPASRAAPPAAAASAPPAAATSAPPAGPRAAPRRLFRDAAVSARRATRLGRIVLVQPLSIHAAVLAAVLVAGAVVAFLALGRFTEHRTVHGRLASVPAVVTVRAPQSGTVVEHRVAEGDAVERGQTLLVLSSDRVSAEIGETQRRIADAVRERLASLESQLLRLDMLEGAERAALEARFRALETEARGLDEMIAARRRHVRLADEALERQRRLRAAGYVADEQVAIRREATLEQQAQLDALLLERNRVELERAELESQRSVLPLKFESEAAELERAIGAAGQELAENEARRRIVVQATSDGTVTAVVAELGQYVDPSTSLLSIVPRGARLRAELYVPSRAVGMVDTGDRLLLRYAAHPYQRYGHHGARIVGVTLAVLPIEASLPPGAAPGAAAEPVYRVTAELDSQQLPAYGAPRPLRVGMRVEADVLGESRPLYEWMLDPLASLRDRGNRH